MSKERTYERYSHDGIDQWDKPTSKLTALLHFECEAGNVGDEVEVIKIFKLPKGFKEGFAATVIGTKTCIINVVGLYSFKRRIA